MLVWEIQYVRSILVEEMFLKAGFLKEVILTRSLASFRIFKASNFMKNWRFGMGARQLPKISFGWTLSRFFCFASRSDLTLLPASKLLFAVDEYCKWVLGSYISMGRNGHMEHLKRYTSNIIHTAGYIGETNSGYFFGIQPPVHTNLHGLYMDPGWGKDPQGWIPTHAWLIFLLRPIRKTPRERRVWEGLRETNGRLTSHKT